METTADCTRSRLCALPLAMLVVISHDVAGTAVHERGIRFVSVWNESRPARGEDMIEEKDEGVVVIVVVVLVVVIDETGYSCVGIEEERSVRSTLFISEDAPTECAR